MGLGYLSSGWPSIGGGLLTAISLSPLRRFDVLHHVAVSYPSLFWPSFTKSGACFRVFFFVSVCIKPAGMNLSPSDLS